MNLSAADIFRLPFAYTTQPLIKDSEITFDGDDAIHLAQSLRLWSGDSVIISDGAGNGAVGKIIASEKSTLSAVIIDLLPPLRPNRIQITIGIGVPAGNVFDDIIRQLTELGADNILPLNTDFTQIPKRLVGQSKLERWQKIALESGKQCQRFYYPKVLPVATINKLITRINEFDCIYFGEPAGESPLNEFNNDKPANYLVLIGPEGGFSNREIDILQKHNAIPINLGPRRLKVATAAAAIITLAKANSEQW